MLGVSHVEVCISARFAGGGVRFHTVVFLIQYILHKDKTYNTRERFLVKLSINNHIVGLLIVHKNILFERV